MVQGGQGYVIDDPLSEETIDLTEGVNVTTEDFYFVEDESGNFILRTEYPV